jgi:hypothetical protein
MLRICLILSACLASFAVTKIPVAAAEEIALIENVAAQPLKAQAERVIAAMEFLGEPLDAERLAKIQAAIKQEDDAQAIKEIQQALDPLVIASVNINPESRVKVAAGPVTKRLVQEGWSLFLVKVHNEAGVTAPLRITSPNAAPVYKRSSGSPRGDQSIQSNDVKDRWLDVQTFDAQPLNKDLSGLAVEYRIAQVFCRDAGKREASFGFDVGQGTQDIGFRNALSILFECDPAVKVQLKVRDDDGQPAMGQFVFRDRQGRVYPARSRRLAPDFFFHDQIYREDGELVLLPPGDYTMTFTRGPEYRVSTRDISIPDAETHELSVQLERWIKLTDHHWFSGDHHIHAAGCAHYESPTEGVTPEDMMRHILGEDLNVGCVLSWGPCWYHQKTFFEGDLNRLSHGDYLMRYDVEVSGFPSAHAGHLCLLNLKEDDYTYPAETEFDYSYGAEKGHFFGTKTDLIGQWPSWDLPILQWGKQQGGVVGFSHSGWGLELPDDKLPNYAIPPFNGIGANEYIVDVCHDTCDFISSVDTPAVWELNIWYHTLNCGYTCRISGETDFPCIYGDRVGLGRVYVKLDPSEQLTYENWIQGIKQGRSYVGDGLSHLFDFSINEFEVGSVGADDRASVLAVDGDQKVKVKVRAAALLGEKPDENLRSRKLSQKPYWHVERARVGNSRNVPVELIVNGLSVETREITADGEIVDVEFDYPLKQSSWVAVRIFPSSHTNPIFVEVDGKPIRASKRSAQWCLDSVDVCWKAKRGQIRKHELTAAEEAYDFARQAYRQILEEAFDDRE